MDLYTPITVRITWGTDADGMGLDTATDDLPTSFYGPFTTMGDALEWMDSYPDDDTDVHDIEAGTFPLLHGTTINPAAIID